MLPSKETILWLDVLQETAIKHIKARTIWLPYYKQQIQLHFANDEFWIKFHLNMFIRVYMTIHQYCFW